MSSNISTYTLSSLLVAAFLSFSIPIGAAKKPLLQSITWESATMSGQSYYSKGEMQRAAEQFKQAISMARLAGNAAGQQIALMFLSDAYRSLGMVNAAIEALNEADTLQSERYDPRQLVLLLSRYAATFQMMGEYAAAGKHIEDGLKIAHTLNDEELLAILYNDLGNLSANTGDLKAAAKAFAASNRHGRNAGDKELYITAAVNFIRTRLNLEDYDRLPQHVDDALKAIKKLEDSRTKAELLLSVGSLYRTTSGQAHETLRTFAHEAYGEGLAASRRVGDQRTESYALGYLGQFHEENGEWDAALKYTRQAVFIAQLINADESLYRWQWQNGRILKSKGLIDQALISYGQSVGTLQKIRFDLTSTGRGTFRQIVGPIFYEYADLLLQQTAGSTGKERVQYLEDAREALEQVKVAEVQDYYQDECVRFEGAIEELDKLAKRQNTAIFYPVLLSDRVELLVSLPDGLTQFTTHLKRRELVDQVNKLRLDLQTPFSRELYLAGAQKLYRWLISPVEAELIRQNVQTIVFVPDGILRSIPVAALYDRNEGKFLIEKYAVATTLGITLTDPRPIERQDVEVLLNGVSKSVQNFKALPNVALEIEAVSKIFPARIYENETFLLDTATKEMSEGLYSIVHIASHGKFDSDPRKSFILTYDDRLTMDQLEDTVGLRRYQENPLELLVLSACQTAAGDERSALGLAGVALRAGARSALATLWLIDDEAASKVMEEFYKQLKNQNTSKAKALQAAQLSVMREENHQHPFFWAPFLMIGNWL